MERRRRLARWGGGALALALLLAGLLALRASQRPPVLPDAVLGRGMARAPLAVGAARVPFALPSVVSRAGYPFPQPRVERGSDAGLGARALLLEAGEVRLALVGVDLLLIPESLRAAVRARVPAGIELALVATHTHSGPGGFDARLLAGLAGTGWPSARVEAAVVDAAVEAVRQAAGGLAPARLAWVSGEVPGLNRSRAEGTPVSARLTWLQLSTARATHALVVHAAHPTLVGRSEAVLDADHPGRVALHAGEGLTLALQGAVGNASVPAGGGAGSARAAAHARAVEAAARGLGAPSPGSGNPVLGFARVRLALPGPDARRLVPAGLRAPAEALLADLAPASAELSLWRLGDLRLLLVPGEVTGALEPALLEASGATALVGLADGYLGYLEAPALVDAGAGEAPRQVLGAQAGERLVGAAGRAKAALGALGDGPQPPSSP